uniref:Anti-proliferative protein domain-containing protein n=1 Tax=Homalodisca liturata TaxID=320908 RepID=A0A1B6IYM6_9HEMI
MLIEITSAAEFLVRLLQGQHQVKQLNEAQLASFKGSLISLLKSRYQNHWFPEYPNRGSAYRCIRINTKMDPIVAQACNATGCSANSLRALFPHELTLWIDPEEVSYRFGENGSICVLYDKETKEEQVITVSTVIAPPRQSPELYLDPRQMEPIDPMTDFYY